MNLHSEQFPPEYRIVRIVKPSSELPTEPRRRKQSQPGCRDTVVPRRDCLLSVPRIGPFECARFSHRFGVLVRPLFEIFGPRYVTATSRGCCASQTPVY
jgi:hypothetical protein